VTHLSKEVEQTAQVLVILLRYSLTHGSLPANNSGLGKRLMSHIAYYFHKKLPHSGYS